MWKNVGTLAALVSLALAGRAAGDVGDPQIKTDHPWYPGELACSTFERLAATQAGLFERVTGLRPETDEQKALAAWLWRSTHYSHGEEGALDLWGTGFVRGGETKTREYWTGLFAHGFGLCGTTHAQWSAEMEALLGHGRSRVAGVEGHNAFEVFLTGGPYGAGKWVLLDHDLSTVVFDPEGKGLLSAAEVGRDLDRLIDPSFRPERQQGWPLCGFAAEDGRSYARFLGAEYQAGYAGPPPTVHLRRGESLRRYLKPGLDDGRTFVFWGRNYGTAGVPGPERAHTWVDQPERMHGRLARAGYKPGQARFANAVYTYRPDFATADYREGTVDEGPYRVTFEFETPYVIAATPSDSRPWGVYDPGTRNGLVVRGKGGCPVSVSTDDGATWYDAGRLDGALDLTDRVKGHQHYRLRLHAGAAALKGSGFETVTVCQASAPVMPRLKDGGSRVWFESSGRAIVSAGPESDRAKAHVVAGAFGTPTVTLELTPPRGAEPVVVYAAAHVLSGNPPDPKVKYQVESSADGGATWSPVVKDWTIPRLGPGQQPADFWSQSLCYGSAEISRPRAKTVRVRFRNDGGKAYARCEAQLAYKTGWTDATEVTFDWSDDAGPHRSSHLVSAESPAPWDLPTGRDVVTRWVEMTPRPASRRAD